MDFELTDEQRSIQQTAREFTDSEIVPVAGKNSRTTTSTPSSSRKIAAQGYLGAIVPREYGGAGLDYITYAIALRADRARLLGDAHGRLGPDLARLLDDPALGHRGAEAEVPAAAVLAASGSGCFGLTEPDTGSGAADQKTRAAQQDDGSWLINGAKMWISLGNYARLALVFAQTDPSLGHKGLACFLVETDQPGFRPSEIEGKMGLGLGHRRRSRSTTSSPGRTRCSAASATASRSR